MTDRSDNPAEHGLQIGQLLRRAEDDSFVSLVIRLREDGRLAGMFNISEIVRRAFQSGYVGYGGIAGLEGRGYSVK